MFNMEEVWAAVERKELKCNTLKFDGHGNDLTIFNYTQSTEFSKNWNHLTRNLRGAVLDMEGNYVSRSLPKFFHVNEMPETQREKLMGRAVTAYQKLDGSLINLCNWHGEWIFSSKCSFTSPYAQKARSFISPEALQELNPAWSYVFEVRFAEDEMRRVVELPDGLWLLSVVDTRTGRENLSPFTLQSVASVLGCFLPASRKGTFDEFYQEYQSLEGTEGYVLVFDDDGSRVKLKTSWYYLRNKFLNLINSPDRAKINIQDYLDNFDGDVELFMEIVPPDYQEEVRGYVRDVQKAQQAREELVDKAFKSVYSTDKKLFALEAQAYEPWLRAALFAKYDNKDYSKFLKV